jgi:hypothetical protein
MIKASVWVLLLPLVLLACGGAIVMPTSAPSPTLAAATASPSAPTLTVPAPTPVTSTAPASTPEPTATRVFTNPTFINHPAPSYTLDFSEFENAGCTESSNTGLGCSPDSPLGKLGCDEIQKPSDLLAALEPQYPIALCFVVPYRRNSDEPPAGSYFYRQGGLLGMYARFVILRDGEFEIIHSLDELAAVFAPIESPDEALAYALAATGFTAEYGFKFEPQWVYLSDVIEDTFVTTQDDGYTVRLFHFRLFGCGPHDLMAADFHVWREGTIEPGDRRALYKDPNLDNVCID